MSATTSQHRAIPSDQKMFRVPSSSRVWSLFRPPNRNLFASRAYNGVDSNAALPTNGDERPRKRSRLLTRNNAIICDMFNEHNELGVPDRKENLSKSFAGVIPPVSLVRAALTTSSATSASSLPTLVAFSVKNLEKKPVREPNVIPRESRHVDRNVFRSLIPRLGHTNKGLKRENAFVRAGIFSDPPEPEVEGQSCNVEPDCDTKSEANASGDQSRLFDFSFQSVANTTLDTEVDGEEVPEGYEKPEVEPDRKEAKGEREINTDDAIHGNTTTRERIASLPKPPAPSNLIRNLKRRRSSSEHNDAPNSGVDKFSTPEDDIPTIGRRLKEVEDRPAAPPRDEFEFKFGRCLFAAQEGPSDGQ